MRASSLPGHTPATRLSAYMGPGCSPSSPFSLLLRSGTVPLDCSSGAVLPQPGQGLTRGPAAAARPLQPAVLVPVDLQPSGGAGLAGAGARLPQLHLTTRSAAPSTLQLDGQRVGH